MESNGFQNNHNKNQRLRSTVFNSRSRVQSREQSPAKSYKSFLPVSNFTANGSFGISAEGNRNSRETRKNAMMFNSTATRRTFHQAAGLSTVDQGLIQKRSPWNGTSFVNEGANERSFRFAAVKNIFNRKTYSDPEVRHNNGWVDEKNSDISTETSTRSSGSLKTVNLSFHMDSASTVPRPAKNKVFLLSDSSLTRMKKASSIYIDKNTAFHKQRKKHIEKTIEDKHRSQVKRQMCESEQQSKERYDRNISNMNELKNVRKKFWSEKKKRVSSTYVSVAALDTPEVDRYAYGLPEEGKEYTFVKKSFVKSKTDYKDKWDKSVQKAKSIVKLLDLKEKVKQTRTLPILKPLTSQSKRTKLFENEANNCEPMKEEDEVAETIDENRNNCDTPEKNCDTPDVSNTNKTDSLIHTLLDIGSEVSSLHGTTTDLDTDFEDL